MIIWTENSVTSGIIWTNDSNILPMVWITRLTRNSWPTTATDKLVSFAICAPSDLLAFMFGYWLTLLLADLQSGEKKSIHCRWKDWALMSFSLVQFCYLERNFVFLLWSLCTFWEFSVSWVIQDSINNQYRVCLFIRQLINTVIYHDVEMLQVQIVFQNNILVSLMDNLM